MTISEQQNTAAPRQGLGLVHTLDGAERDALRARLRAAAAGGAAPARGACREAVEASALPLERIGATLSGGDIPFCLLRNLPVDALAQQWTVGPAPLASGLLLGVTAALGLTNFGYHEEKNGAILQDVHPIAGAEDSQSNAGRVAFHMHVESPFLPRAARPEVGALICLNNETATPTRIATVELVKRQLSARHVLALRQPDFRLRHDQSFEVNGYTLSVTTALLKEVDGRDETRCGIYAEGAHAAAQEAVDAWKRAADAVALDLVLEPGDLLLFNNYRCVHGRGAVEGRRWLKRVYSTRDTSLLSEGLISVWRAMAARHIDHSF
ncbi:TauD/TfdA family dioxygenase [Pseudoduganella namucuonensis]|uniref:Taurine catabolism dioxygenase TauD, TfdA family n=1 Tax=Pseudoduganella namucuonensis TaxID=1035707 RepID=A0A1I7LXW0_9BURK|nr:TauD/TfdA family dioxygenase [Pseudoduganella namucuonensis]SFV14407.1 Taurine catabolism dioxygenase TauD, TfdA family [Pseudoduganella namucuonensis]